MRIMSKLKKILLVPYFGPLPDWFDKYKKPDGYEFVLDMNLDDFKKRVRDKLKIDWPLHADARKVCDYRPTFGVLYEEEINGFDFWGTTDLDCVYGDVDKFITDDLLENTDIYSSHDTYVSGPFSLYRNAPVVNYLFMKQRTWQYCLIQPQTNGWVETSYSRLVEKSGLDYKYLNYQGDPDNLNLARKGKKLYQDGREIMYFHFRRQKNWPNIKED